MYKNKIIELQESNKNHHIVIENKNIIIEELQQQIIEKEESKNIEIDNLNKIIQRLKMKNEELMSKFHKKKPNKIKLQKRNHNEFCDMNNIKEIELEEDIKEVKSLKRMRDDKNEIEDFTENLNLKYRERPPNFQNIQPISKPIKKLIQHSHFIDDNKNKQNLKNEKK